MFNRRSWILERQLFKDLGYIQYQDIYDKNQSIQIHYSNGQYYVLAFISNYYEFEYTLASRGIEFHSIRKNPLTTLNNPTLVGSKASWCSLDFSNFILPLAIQENMLPSVLQNMTNDIMHLSEIFSTPKIELQRIHI